MDTPPLPPDVAAYLEAAIKEIMKEREFTPTSEDQLAGWIEEHFRECVERAREKMARLWNLLQRPGVMDAVAAAMSDEVYERIPKGEPGWNSRYVAYAEAHGRTPDEMFEHDSRRMTNFLCWAPDRPGKKEKD